MNQDRQLLLANSSLGFSMEYEPRTLGSENESSFVRVKYMTKNS
jgi:hypothetical protein